jgi:hypothetical protein
LALGFGTDGLLADELVKYLWQSFTSFLSTASLEWWIPSGRN